MATATPLQDERRHLRRVPAAELEVRLRPGRQWFRKGDVVDAADFTREGVAIVTEHSLKDGQKLLLDLTLRLDRGEIHQNRVVARVNNQRPEGGRTRYGLKFDFRGNGTMKALDTQARLGRMEGILERIENFKARTRSGDELVAAYRKAKR